MKIEVAVPGSPSLIVLMVSQCGRKATLNFNWLYAHRDHRDWKPKMAASTFTQLLSFNHSRNLTILYGFTRVAV